MIKRAFDIFLRAPGSRPFFVLFCLLCAGVFDLLSVGVVLPVIALAGGGIDRVASSPLHRMISEMFAFLGVFPSLPVLLLFLIVFLTLKFALSFLAMAYVSVAVADVATRIRTLFLENLLKVRWSYFTDHPPSLLSNLLSNEADRASETYYYSALTITEGLKSSMSLCIAFLISGWFFLVAGSGALLFALPMTYLLAFSHRSDTRQWSLSQEMTQNMQDILQNIKPLKSMGLEEPYSRLFRQNIFGIRKMMVHSYLARHALTYGQDFLVMLFICAGVFMGSFVFHLPLPELLGLGFVFIQMTYSIKKFQYSQQMLGKTHAAYEKCLDLIAETQTLQEQEKDMTKEEMPSLEKGCYFENVSFSYGEKIVFQEVTCEIPVKQLTVFTGASGVGKTTFMDLFIGFHHPKSGVIKIDDAPLSHFDLKKWRSLIGYVPQEITLLKSSIFENVVFGDLSLTEEQVHDALQKAGASAFISALPQGIYTNVGQMGSKLSGGQRQRLALARALVRKPKILILDEVTSALDLETEQEICENIAKLKDKYTILVITHREAWLKNADRIYEVRAQRMEIQTKI